MTSTKREDVARVRDRLRDPASSSAWNREAADMLDDLLAERDAARAEVKRLREALKDVASFLPDLEGASRYLRRISDMRPAMEHAAALTTKEPGA